MNRAPSLIKDKHQGKWILGLQILLMLLTTIGPLILPGHFYFSIRFDSALKYFAFILAFPGCVLLLGAIITMGRSLTPSVTPRKSSPLIVHWPFSIIRNPIYTGGLLMSFGWAVWHHSIVSGVAAFSLIIVLNIKVGLEEKFLLARFGQTYQTYCREVGRFIPGVGLKR